MKNLQTIIKLHVYEKLSRNELRTQILAVVSKTMLSNQNCVEDECHSLIGCPLYLNTLKNVCH